MAHWFLISFPTLRLILHKSRSEDSQSPRSKLELKKLHWWEGKYLHVRGASVEGNWTSCLLLNMFCISSKRLLKFSLRPGRLRIFTDILPFTLGRKPSKLYENMKRFQINLQTTKPPSFQFEMQTTRLIPSSLRLSSIVNDQRAGLILWRAQNHLLDERIR